MPFLREPFRNPRGFDWRSAAIGSGFNKRTLAMKRKGPLDDGAPWQLKPLDFTIAVTFCERVAMGRVEIVDELLEPKSRK